MAEDNKPQTERDRLLQAAQRADAVAKDGTRTSAERAKAESDVLTLLAAISALPQSGYPTPITDAIELSNYHADKAKRGIADFIYRVLDANEITAKAIPSVFGVEPLPRQQRMESKAWWQSPEQKQQAAQAQQPIDEAIANAASRWFNAGPPRAPKNNIERYGGIAIQAITEDPIMSLVGARGPVGIAFNVATAPAPAVSSALSYDVVSDAMTSLGAPPETADTVAKVVATVVGVISGATVGSIAPAAIAGRDFIRGTAGTPPRPPQTPESPAGWAGETPVRPAEDLWKASREAAEATRKLYESQQTQSAVDKATDFVVTSSMKEVISDIVASDPVSVSRAADLSRNLAEKIPGFNVGAGVLLHDNAVIRKNMETLLRESPQFRQNIENNLQDLRDALSKRQAAIYGNASNTEIEAEVLKTLRSGNYGISLTSAKKRTDSLRTALDGLTEQVRTADSPVDIGKAASNLIDATMAAVRGEQRIEYSRVLNTYEAKGVEFPAESVAELYSFVKSGMDANLFTPYPSLKSHLDKMAPKQKELPAQQPGLSELLSGVRTTRAVSQQLMEFEPLTLTQLDSLKREINSALSKTDGRGTSYTLLSETKAKLRELIGRIEGFGPEYQAVDRSFYERVGIPTDSAGLSKLDTTKLAEQIAPMLNKPTVVSEFLAFTGKEGEPIVRAAMLAGLNKAFMKRDGSLDFNGYSRFLRDNRKVIEAVPGLSQELSDIRSAVASVDNTMSILQQQHDSWVSTQADNYLKAVHAEGLQSTITKLLTKPERSEQYMKTIRNLDPESSRIIKNGIRSALFNRAMSQPNAREFISANERTYKEWFGSAYLKNLDDLAKAGDIINGIDPSKMPYAFSYTQADAFQRQIGSSAPQIASIVRDRISSIWHKASILLSRKFTSTTKQAKDKEMMRLLSDPSAVETIANAARDYETKKIDVVGLAASIGSVFTSKGIVGGVRGFEAAEIAAETPSPK